MIKLDITRVTDIEVDGIDTRDHPDFCNAYISAASYEENGKFRDLTEEELDELNDNHSDFVYEAVMKKIY